MKMVHVKKSSWSRMVGHIIIYLKLNLGLMLEVNVAHGLVESMWLVRSD